MSYNATPHYMTRSHKAYRSEAALVWLSHYRQSCSFVDDAVGHRDRATDSYSNTHGCGEPYVGEKRSYAE